MSARKNSSNGEPEESTRDRILQAAVNVFAEKGYHGAGMSDIGQAANIQRGALYYHIGSKEELLYDLTRRHVEVALDAGRKAIEGHDDARDQFRALTQAHIRTLADRRADVTVAEREMHVLTGERAAALAKLRREYQDLFGEVINRGADQGVFSRPTLIDVMGVLGMLNYTHVWLDPHGSEPVERVADRLSSLILDGLRVRVGE